MRRSNALPTATLILCVIGLLQNSRNLYYVRHHPTTGEENDGEGNSNDDRPRPAASVEKFWETPRSGCVHVENVCGDGGGWFYGPPPNASSGGGYGDSRGTDRSGSSRHHRPSISLVMNFETLAKTHIYLNGLRIDGRIHFSVSSLSTRRDDNRTATSCVYSAVPHHLVVQSAYNDMMGEFYSRTILGLNYWMRRHEEFATTTTTALPPYHHDYEDVQIYVHFVDRRKGKMLVGHELFLMGLPNNGIFDSLLSLMPMKNGTCRCYEQLVFCGYRARNGTAISTKTHIDDETDNRMTIFEPGPFVENPMVDASHWNNNDGNGGYGKLRTDLINTYMRIWPDLDERISMYRKHILTQSGIMIDNNSTSDAVFDWRIVGLTHRTSRRMWLNIDDVVTKCNQKFMMRKIVCITINVEDTNTAMEQLLMHRSLHAIVGVHGAQLTQAILLPTRAHVLELLPWVPYYLWGGWVTTTQAPTPLGVVFTGTNLNHVGHPLGRDSVPLCLHVNSSDVEADRKCLMNETSGVLDKFRWADRDYIVSPNTVGEFVSTFLLKDDDDDSTCEEMRAKAERTSFVLYNAYCESNGKRGVYTAQQYYREENWMLPKKPP
jgi:hypothetical protein